LRLRRATRTGAVKVIGPGTGTGDRHRGARGSEKLAQALGQAFVIDNRAGAGGSIGTT